MVNNYWRRLVWKIQGFCPKWTGYCNTFCCFSNNRIMLEQVRKRLKANFKASRILIRLQISASKKWANISSTHFAFTCLPVLELLATFNDLHSSQCDLSLRHRLPFRISQGTFYDPRSVQTCYIFGIFLKDLGRSYLLRASIVLKNHEKNYRETDLRILAKLIK